MKKLTDYDFEMDMDELTDLIDEAVNKSKKGEGIDFEDIVDLHNALDRQIYIGNVSAGLGVAVDTMIRFWNKYDNENNTPIEDRKPITNRQLQTILYYIQIQYYKEKRIFLFNEDFEAWQSGPTIPLVYYRFCSNGVEPIIFFM